MLKLTMEIPDDLIPELQAAYSHHYPGEESGITRLEWAQRLIGLQIQEHIRRSRTARAADSARKEAEQEELPEIKVRSDSETDPDPPREEEERTN